MSARRPAAGWVVLLAGWLAAQAADPAAPPALPRDPAGAVEKIRALLRDDLYEDALDLASAAAGRWPDHAAVLVARGDALYRRGDFDEAEQAYRLAEAADPNDPAAHFGVGRILRTRGRYADAAASFSRAAALGPAVPKHLRVLANHLAKRADAITLLERYLELTRSLPDRGGEDEPTVRNVEAWLALLRQMGDRPLSRMARSEPVTATLRRGDRQPSLRLGMGKLKNQPFVFDTGATGVTISPRLAARLRLEPIRPFTITGTGSARTETGDLVVVDRVTVGDGIVIENVPATVRDPTGPEEGLVGPSLFGSFDVRFDLRAGKVFFLRPGTAPAGREEPFRNVGGQIVIRAALNGVALNALVDTGATSTMVARSALRRVPGLQALPGQWFPGTTSGVGGALKDRKVIQDGTVAFAGRSHTAAGLVSGDFSHFSRALESEIYLLLGASHLDDTPFTIRYGAMTVVFEDPPAR
jgi:tetratricopeptide (TPR) repeat protein